MKKIIFCIFFKLSILIFWMVKPELEVSGTHRYRTENQNLNFNEN
jgi:hypothetical protein